MRRPAHRKLLNAPRDWLRKVRKLGRQFLYRPFISRDGILGLRFAIFLEAIVRASPGTRMKTFQQLYPALSGPHPASPPVICEINSLDDFESCYKHLAALLGRAGKMSPPSEIEFLRKIDKQRPMYQG